MNSLIIVESKNDKYFIKAFIKKLNLQNIEVGEPICSINDFECLGGYTNLENNLNEIKLDEYDKIGIILDADEVGIEERIKFINKALKSICSDVAIENINEPKKSKELNIEIICYIMNVDGKGELETVMRKVASKNAIRANCLESWRECLIQKGENVKDKTFDKFWIDIYQRYDNCKENQSKADENCKGEKSIKKDIWNFEHALLKDLKKFLELF